MRAKINEVDDHGKKYKAIMFVCPGCIAMDGGSGVHMLPVNTSETNPSWTWDGNLDAPTLSPSILSHGGGLIPDEAGNATRRGGVCHSYLRAGVFEFLADCTHEFADQHVPMIDLPDWVEDD